MKGLKEETISKGKEKQVNASKYTWNDAFWVFLKFRTKTVGHKNSIKVI